MWNAVRALLNLALIAGIAVIITDAAISSLAQLLGPGSPAHVQAHAAETLVKLARTVCEWGDDLQRLQPGR